MNFLIEMEKYVPTHTILFNKSFFLLKYQFFVSKATKSFYPKKKKQPPKRQQT
jgi:hypothetical protein